MRGARRAFTLLEMLIAVLLLTLLVATAVYSFRFVLLNLSKQQFSGINRLLEYTQLRGSIASMRYYVVDNYDSFSNPMNQLHYFFKGNPKQMVYITQNPVFSNSTAVAKVECKDKKLLYTEEPLYRRIDFTQPKVLKDSSQKVLFSKLLNCEFIYHKNRQTQSQLEETLPDSVEFKLTTKKGALNFYVNIQTDFNVTKAYIENDKHDF